MDLLSFLMQSHDLSERACVDQFASNWTSKLVNKGALLAQQGELETKETIILDGRVVSNIYDPEGRAVCVGMHVGACVLTPNIARTRNGASLITAEATSDTLVAQMDTSTLTDIMVASEPVRNWANGVLRDALARKADREWCLAALGGSDRLNWFRGTFPGYEDNFVHSHVASFLGITPVTLSRLRSKDRNK